jgi:predicted aspartyl protease
VIHGVVIGLQARMDIILCLSGRSDLEVECVVDTGFEGFLTLPLSMIADLNLSYAGRIDTSLPSSAW